MKNGNPPVRSRVKQRRFVLALDYGTTYTGVAYATPESDELPFEEIDIVHNWGPVMGNTPKIPSVISFSLPSEKMEDQWGSDLSEDAIAMINTKLDLEPQTVLGELELTLHALDGMKNLNFEQLKTFGPIPEYTTMSAEQIVTEYLERVFRHLAEDIDRLKEYKDVVPTDIVVTIPAAWSYEAKNATYRAVLKAGFNKDFFPLLNEVIFVTEPEAAAIYTARYLKEDKGEEFLKPGECFVLCDAGGGTVDVVSYRVIQVEPSLKLERVGLPTSGKCGSTQIDRAFKKWLRNYLGDNIYQRLNDNSDHERISSHTTQGRSMRHLMATFDELKKAFHKNEKDMPFDLPEPLNSLNLDKRVDGGEIILTNATMAGFFQECVGEIIQLIEGHIAQIKRMNRRTKNVFLVGGFGDSKYLQDEIEFSLRLRKIKLRVPETSWTAVVQGAVICGIEKETTANLSRAISCPKHYGISVSQQYSQTKHKQEDLTLHPLTNQHLASGQLIWLFSKGDLILSDQPSVVFQPITVSFRDSDPKERKIAIWTYLDDEDRPTKTQDAIDELIVSHELEYTLTDLPIKDLQKSRGKNGVFYNAPLVLKLTLTAEGLKSSLDCKATNLATGFEFW